MKKRVLTTLLVMALATGVLFLVNALLGGVSNEAYATPDRGSNCSQCHKSNSPQTRGTKGFTVSFFPELCNEFSSTGRNPFFILEPGYQLIMEGKEKKKDIHLSITVLNETKTVNGVETRVIEERETVGGVLAEVSRNYFAICNRDNSVFYFGEDVDIYENGQVVSNEGAWLADENGAAAGIMMPGTILIGAKYFQEIAPGVAMDRAEILSMTEKVETPAGVFENCLKTKETTPLERGTAFKFYAPDVGLIKDGNLTLVEYGFLGGP